MIIHADILEWAKTYDGPPFMAILCDPPYHLTEITKRFGGPNAAPAQYGKDGAFQRASRGFMNAKWDGGSIAFQPETWAALAQHLYPGAFGMAFSGSRGWHRMAVAIEDAGLIIHPTIFCWNYSTGFPKATRIDTQVDRKAGATRAKVGTKKHQPKFAAAELGYREKDNGYNSKSRESFDVTAPATALAEAWQGHRYGMQAMKPAIEPIIVFQKPYAGRPVDSITATGAGALNVDGGRIGTDEPIAVMRSTGGRKFEQSFTQPNRRNQQIGVQTDGRWPANFALVHHPACNGACHPDCVVRRLGEQSGESESKRSQRGTVEIFDEFYKRAPSWHGESTERGHEDSGTAARFFHQSDWMAERLEAADAVGYFAKASRGEREAGLDPRQIALMREGEEFSEATINDGRKKSIDNPYQRGETTRRNTHPTIKPIALTRWLATLLLPPAMYAPRRLLIPFAGVASEMIGAKLAGWEEVVGVELEEEHIKIAQARLAYWEQMKYKITEASAEINVKISNKANDGQLEMF